MSYSLDDDFISYPLCHSRHTSEVLIAAYATSYVRVEKPVSKSDQKIPTKRTAPVASPPSPPVSPPPPAQSSKEPSPDSQRESPVPGAMTDSQSNAVPPPKPCERCVRSNKVCKGGRGGRCDSCKALHQRCSNSTLPPRGRHASSLLSGLAVEDTVPSSWATRPKRKAVSKTSVAEEEDDDDDDDDDENDGGSDETESRTDLKTKVKMQPPQKKRKTAKDDDENDGGSDETDSRTDSKTKAKRQPPQKKRKTAKDNERRSKLLKEVTELESAIKKLQANYTKDLSKLQQTAASLASRVRDLD